MFKTFLRFVTALFLMALSIPPLTLGVVNVFVFLPALFGVVVLAWPTLLRLLRRVCGKSYRAVFRALIAVCVAAGVFFTAEFGVLFYNSFSQAPPSDCVVVVPGSKAAGSYPTILLWGRINAAGSYLKAHPRAVCIATGGQGADETISEAKCIKDWLQKSWGIAENRIYTDDRSTNTAQNFSNAAEIIRQNGLSKNVAVATDGFHEFRCRIIASRRGLTPYSLPARTDGRLVVYLYLRELLALPKSVLFD